MITWEMLQERENDDQCLICGQLSSGTRSLCSQHKEWRSIPHGPYPERGEEFMDEVRPSTGSDDNRFVFEFANFVTSHVKINVPEFRWEVIYFED